MALKTFVKVGNITNLSDARYCAGMEVDLLGFNFDQDSDMDLDTFDEITTWVSGVEFVAEFENSDEYEIQDVLEECDFDYVQVSDRNMISSLAEEIPVIFKCSPADLTSLDPGLPIKILLVEKENDELLNGQEISALQQLARHYTILLGSGIKPENVFHLIADLPIKGIAMKGSEEISPGYKDYDELADILELLEGEN